MYAQPTMEPSYLQDPFGEAGLLSELLEVLGVRVVVDGKVGFHGPELVVLERGAHALGLLGGRVGLLVSVQVVGLVLITTCGGPRKQTRAQWKHLPHDAVIVNPRGKGGGPS